MLASFLRAASAAFAEPNGSGLVRQAQEAVDESGQPWSLLLDDLWCHLRPAGHEGPRQGWKLHLSATAASAPEVLQRALEVLLPAGCPAKFASTTDRLDLLNSAHYPRGGAGKFLTAYPRDDDQFRWLAERLHLVTAGLAGPRVLSDRPYRPGSVVHYRYGGFVRRQVLSNDSELVLVITGPDGEVVQDRRDAYFTPPAWAPPAFPARSTATASPATASSAPAGPVLLGGRFVAREAIRHSNRGGVYRASDVETGSEVIVKQARRHVLGNGGIPATDGLRHEAAVLEALAPLGLTPAVIGLFEQDGDLFLAQELVDAVPLRLWVRQQGGVIGPDTGAQPGVDWTALAETMTQLIDLTGAVHRAGWVIRDLTPTNVMLTPEGPRLVDLEFAARPGETGPHGGTPGYAAPEQIDGAAAAGSADRYALGAIAFMLASGIDPQFAADSEPGRSGHDRMASWLTVLAADGESARRVRPLVLGLTAGDPAARWTLERARRFLVSGGPEIAATEPFPGAAMRRADARERLLADGLGYLCAAAEPESTERLWPAACTAGSVDPCNVQHGAAGVLGTLVRAARHGAGPASLAETVRRAVDWTWRILPDLDRTLPGLHFGRSGTAWALYDAASTMDDAAGRDRAADLALRVPVRWPNPDLAHGAAGAGLTQLRFWSVTGDPRFRVRAAECADALAAAAVRGDGGLRWPIPATFDSRLAGLSHYGFAHGVAGIGYFLLAAGQATGRDDLFGLAIEAGDTLVRSAVRVDGAALWPTDIDRPEDAVEHWCSGSAGIGAFLVRLWQATGRPGYRELAEEAAAAAWRRRWYASPVTCHGLAGIGELLLDLATASVDARYLVQAEAIGDLIEARHAVRDGRRLVPDETNTGFGTEYGIGMAGALDFLLRLRHGGPRAWMVDPATAPNLRSGPPDRSPIVSIVDKEQIA